VAHGESRRTQGSGRSGAAACPRGCGTAARTQPARASGAGKNL